MQEFDHGVADLIIRMSLEQAATPRGRRGCAAAATAAAKLRTWAGGAEALSDAQLRFELVREPHALPGVQHTCSGVLCAAQAAGVHPAVATKCTCCSL